MNNDIIYMARAIELARKGAGSVSTNPMVGAVIVHNDKIIGEGYHKKYGTPHAEVNAVNSVKEDNMKLLKASTMYVSLEPCAHWGKTPPCCDLIIEKGIKRVVIAMQDPFAKVNGEGISRMKRNGVDVEVGVMEDKAKWLNRRFITFHTKKRPYIILKWAKTADGYIDSEREATEPAAWLTNYPSKILVHKWRSQEDAIWVGKNSVVRDNPTLTTRDWFGKNPIRISMDNHNNINNSHNINNNEAKTIIFKDKTIEEIIESLYNKNIQSVFVEGGEYLLNYLIEKGLFDEIREFVSPLTVDKIAPYKIGGIKAPNISNSKIISKQEIGDVTLNIYKNINN